jgi:hypothetical protein
MEGEVSIVNVVLVDQRQLARERMRSCLPLIERLRRDYDGRELVHKPCISGNDSCCVLYSRVADKPHFTAWCSPALFRLRNVDVDHRVAKRLKKMRPRTNDVQRYHLCLVRFDGAYSRVVIHELLVETSAVAALYE